MGEEDQTQTQSPKSPPHHDSTTTITQEPPQPQPQPSPPPQPPPQQPSPPPQTSPPSSTPPPPPPPSSTSPPPPSATAASAPSPPPQNSTPYRMTLRPKRPRNLSSTLTPDEPDTKSEGDNKNKKPKIKPKPKTKTKTKTKPKTKTKTKTSSSTTPTTTKKKNTTPTTTKKKNNVVEQKVQTPQIPIRPPQIPRVVPKTLSSEGEIDLAIRHLRSSDPHLARIIDAHLPPTFDSFHPPFLALTKSILYQQLAYKAGTSIYTRFVSLCGGEAAVVPQTVLALTAPQLRQIGVSGRKASYLHDLASKYCNGILSDSSIVDMDDKSLFTMLTMVKGIGPWSVHMFMIFSLHRPDVLPVGDLGVRKGVQLLHGLEELPRPSQMEQLCEKWRPYRSVGSWYMWRFVEVKGAPTPANTSSVAVGDGLQHQQPQLIDPMSGITGLGACAWGQGNDWEGN